MDIVHPIIEPLNQSASILLNEPLLTTNQEFGEDSSNKQASIDNGILIVYIKSAITNIYNYSI